MSSNLIKVKDFLGKYYPELHYSSIQDKYRRTKLSSLFEQRFIIPSGKTQITIDPGLSGLSIVISGNEILISQDVNNHPNIEIRNFTGSSNQDTDPKNLYNSELFSTMAYIVCQDHTICYITGEIDEPIYVKYKNDYETFSNSVILFEVLDDLSIEIVEEIESVSALNCVMNYILHKNSNIKLTTFYRNHISALSFIFRNIITQNHAIFNHFLFGQGSSNAVDENRLFTYMDSSAEFLGIVNSKNKNFHSILCIQPATPETKYNVSITYKDIVYGKANVSFLPVVHDDSPGDKVTVSISSISLEKIPEQNIKTELDRYLKDIVDLGILERTTGVERFYDNKSKFLLFL
jgi:hypothetical protein